MHHCVGLALKRPLLEDHNLRRQLEKPFLFCFEQRVYALQLCSELGTLCIDLGLGSLYLLLGRERLVGSPSQSNVAVLLLFKLPQRPAKDEMV